MTPATLPRAIGPYSQVVRVGDLLFLSGQISTTPGDITEQTKEVLEKIKLLLEDAGSNLQRVVKTTVYLSDLNDFATMNEVYGSCFSEPYPARATVQVVKLPKDRLIEIDCIANVIM